MKKEIALHLKTFTEHAANCVSEEELTHKLEAKLKKHQSLRLKIGFDPTSRDLHLGHTVLLTKLRKLQELGHQVYLIIGDFTAKIGDPSARTTLRPLLSDQEIQDNASTYTEQAFKILDKKKTKIIYNSTWYKAMRVSQFLPILASYTVARMLERDDFSQRMKENKPLTILEFVYPLIQGYDSVMMDADVEFGGTDQEFNLIVARHIQEAYAKPAEVIVTMPLLLGLDGKNKMSKSLGNYIGITEAAKDMFGKLMSVPDSVMWQYLKLLIDYDLGKLKSMHPKEAKLLLAEAILSRYHSPRVAQRERQEFEKIFSQRKLPSDIPSYEVHTPKVDIIETLYSAGLVTSKNEARRLLTQGAICLVSADNLSETAPQREQTLQLPQGGVVLKVGKRKFLKIISR